MAYGLDSGYWDTQAEKNLLRRQRFAPIRKSARQEVADEMELYGLKQDLMNQFRGDPELQWYREQQLALEKQKYGYDIEKFNADLRLKNIRMQEEFDLANFKRANAATFVKSVLPGMQSFFGPLWNSMFSGLPKAAQSSYDFAERKKREGLDLPEEIKLPAWARSEIDPFSKPPGEEMVMGMSYGAGIPRYGLMPRSEAESAKISRFYNQARRRAGLG
jgi:hypothetical protein